jgi:HlyD family secretion protein
MKLKIVLPSLTAALCISAFLLWSGGRFATPAAALSPRAERSAADGFQLDSGHWVQGIGYVEPHNELRRLVFKVDGVVARCPVSVGSAVKQGETLMVLQNGEQEAEVAVAARELAQARSEQAKIESGIDAYQIAAAESRVTMLREQCTHLNSEYARQQRLFARSAISDQERELARTLLVQKEAELRTAEADLLHLKNYVRPEDRELAAAKVRRAEAQLALMKQRLQDTFLVAPSDGTVLEILKREGEGQRLIDNEPAIVFGDTRRIRIRAEIDERYVRRLRSGQRAVAFGRGLGGESYPGYVAEVRQVMGKRTVFSRAATERKDLDVLQVLLELREGFSAPLGLQVDVAICVDP